MWTNLWIADNTHDFGTLFNGPVLYVKALVKHNLIGLIDDIK